MITFVSIIFVFFAFFSNIRIRVLKKTIVLYRFSRVNDGESGTLEGKQKH